MNHSQEQQRLHQIEERVARIEEHLIALDQQRLDNSSPNMVKSFLIGFCVVAAAIVILFVLVGVFQFASAN